MRWQRAIDAVLRPLGLTHTRYLVLDAAAQLIAEHGDAVPQRAIAERAGLDAATTSNVACRLAEDGQLDRGPDGIDGRAWRVLVTQRGRALLERARPAVDAAAARFYGKRAPA